MRNVSGRISRIDKLFVDRDETNAAEALARRKKFAVSLICGSDVARSRCLQVAILTALRIATRCFPDAVYVVLEKDLQDAPQLVWASLGGSFGKVLMDISGPSVLVKQHQHTQRAVIFGNVKPIKGALRVTFDGWIAKVGPAADTDRMGERQYCPLAGVLAAALAISELFLSFAEITVEAGRRTLAVSLWQPDADASDPSALGIPVEFLPNAVWTLGLGHLGNAYLWSLSVLPYAVSATPRLYLYDFDKVESENVETGLLFNPQDVGFLKTRVCSAWLEARAFQTQLVERRFDSHFHLQKDEPGLALCGFDSNPARRDLATAQFLRVVESGLGGTKNNFDTISMHTLPNPRAPEELWPDLTPEEEEKRSRDQEHLAASNPAYLALDDEECGRYQLADKSIAVPFVGTAAACFVIAETLRLFHGGTAFTDLRFSLSAPKVCFVRSAGRYRAGDHSGITFATVQADSN